MTLIASSVSTTAIAGASLPPGDDREAHRSRIGSFELLESTDGKVRVIVEFAAPALPDAANAADPVAADRARADAIYSIQDQILGRALAARGGLAAAES